MNKSLLKLTAASLALCAGIGAANAETLRWARAGDSITLDPHAQNEGPTHTLAHQIYEPLLQRDMEAKIIPALATSWAPTDNPNVWEFKLRDGVKFHGGEDFTADDVVFSLNRAMQPTSAMKELLSSIKEVRKVDDSTVHIETNGPNPLLPNNLTNLFIMDSDWAVSNGCEEPQDVAAGGDNPCVRSTNGTGAYVLESRKQDSETVLKQNPDYWGKGKFPLEVTEIIYTPIQESATRVSALLSGEVDLIQDVPVQDLARVGETDGLTLSTAPQNRTIFFGMNLGADDLENDTVEGKNPLADVRVRKAMNMAINRDAIKKVVMREQSQPTGVIMPPFVNGWTEELDAYPDYDVAAAKALMEEAGYADGFGLTLNCPNDRYVNDEAICQAAVGMLGQIGINVNLDAKPKAQHFPLIQNKTTDFYMLGWGVPTFDSEYIFNFLAHTTTDKLGSWNATGYSNPELDAKIASLASETDQEVRNGTIAEIWETLKEDTLYLPVHHQVLNWGMSDTIEFAVQPEDQPHFKFLTYKK
ncbi:peptide/nickel transport system substrate-binding protein [Roseibium hamelinense]|uniref:Peptide/nickel transport system substrate-binding protein n=1 Tax=Roseibium hamelinense TaxID=150831 RepID=A0A562SYM9_9HYPH|nr:ABC transporter substrate-binding protein [Roseibium hamelinense]MTI44750.1 ABC transporter substrate-binding protein [Roseibium hamelinense]TWI86064.1 peptide/nickel transport system substrate-binding protein [Roseibium hamelinense]